jgi:hypothetical protein
MKIGLSFDPKAGTLSNVKTSRTTLLRGWPDVTAVETTPDGKSGAEFHPRFRIPSGDIQLSINELDAGTPRGQICFLHGLAPRTGS